jgi:hypothetical protein
MNSVHKNVRVNFLFLILKASSNKNPTTENTKVIMPEIISVSGTKILKLTSLIKNIFISSAKDARRKIKTPLKLS